MVRYLDNNSGFNQWNASRAAAKKPSRMGGFLWWIVLFLAAWWLTGLFMSPRPVAVSAADAPAVTTVDVSALPAVALNSEKISATARGLRIMDVDLTDFARDASGDANMRLLDTEKNAFAEVGLVAAGTTAPTATTVWTESDGAYKWRNADGVEFVRNIVVNDYVITVTDTVRNNSPRDISVSPYARIVRDANSKSSVGVYTGAVAFANGDTEHESWNKIAKRPLAYSTQNGFVGFADQYWETVVSIDGVGMRLNASALSDDLYQADASAAAIAVPAGGVRDITTNIYAGPRERGALRGASAAIVGIDKTMDYGWFWFLARPLEWVINALYAVVGNYGVAIILMTILLRLLMWPLTRKSYVSMAKMQKMQPEMQRIQKLYANDKPRMQMEMMRLYQTHKTSPMSGCLPMLIQIPIFFALYKALLVSVQMRNAHFLWISDLAAMDPYFILPILMGATMWWQQSLQSVATKKSDANDPVAATQRAMRWMPVMFTILFAWMPAGLVLYWTVSNLCGILQMQIIKRRS